MVTGCGSLVLATSDKAECATPGPAGFSHTKPLEISLAAPQAPATSPLALGSDILASSVVYRTMSEGQNPYGDGHASSRIAEGLWGWLNGATPALNLSQQFDSGIREQTAAVA